MDRLAEQVVAWHNSHPLAKRISIYDVHTIGVVALPFMRNGGAGLPGAPGAGRGPIEPVLTDAVSTESLAAWGTEESTIAANTNAAHLDALADQEEPPPAAAGTGWRERVRGLLSRDGKNAASSWPAFSERFVEKLSPRQIARFAQQNGYSVRPGDASWPQRVVAIDDHMMTRDGVVGGAWPFELYLMSAAIDAGRSRTRILAGRSAGAALPPMLGRRCLDVKRVALAALLPLCVVSAAGMAWWPRGAGQEAQLAAAAGAASAASAAASVAAPALQLASAPVETGASSALASASPASAASEALAGEILASAASAPASAAMMAEAAASSASSAAPVIPDIRPRFVESARPPGYKGPPLLASATPLPAPSPTPLPASSPMSSSATMKPSAGAAAAAPQPAAAASETMTLPMTPVKPDIQEAALKGTPVVALVAPPMRNKAEAEATLARMRDLVRPLQPDPTLMQAQLFESPEGWRPAVWPFASRIEAQLVNATLVARGLHTKAVNF